MTTVVNKYKSKFDVYIGRPTIFGNPFSIGEDGDRAEVIKKFRTYFNARIKKDAHFKQEVLKLKGKTLGCYCKPQDCHGDIIAAYIDK